MPQGRSGLSSLTAGNTILDAGEVWFNISTAILENAGWDDAITAGGAVRVGGTRGGNTFNPGRIIREMPVDGSIGPVKGFARRAGSRPTLTVNMLELTVANLQQAIAAASSSVTASGLTKVEGDEIDDASYITNVAIATTLKDEAEPVIIVLENVLVLDAPEFSFADEDEMVLSVTFVGHTLSSDPNVEAFAVYHPADHVISVAINEADQDLANNATLQLTLTFVKTGTPSEDVTYESSNEAAATVNAAGLVSGVANGVTTVTVRSVANPFATDSITVTVVDP